MTTKKYFQIKKKTDKKGEIFIYGDIVSEEWFANEVTAPGFKQQLDELGNVSEIDVHINSSGGNVFEGHAIYNMLKMHKAKINIYIDALAASIASVIAMSGDTIFMHKNSFLMIHNSWIMTVGNAKELRDTADLLDKTDEASNQAYLDRALNISEEELKELLDAETWLTASEALEKGFIDEILEPNEIAASISDERYKLFKSVPSSITKQDNNVTKHLEEQKLRRKIIKECETLKLTLNL
ncbi:Clp protease ClpP [Staphylococcus sp. EG-SA-6]|jgi:ATP-dependent protease ClpP protease subunit|uniref:head maturation protease, ClpP-related n=1 Tax=Staphylococcus TaxID=1279 RepID=UPI00069E0593|nr:MULTISPECIES: head maturation protease, ClpP-related [Staphylococcus]MBN4935707.1 Clp protease ClpP [Staphylococcus sp. EG-SA-6]MDU4913466.1 Clp protease ClpP [Staphylococcus epidermidis]OFK82957.1 Clp protease ClpP [Staphylococcus sp. HMSC057A02]DAI84644.1 MAG TPA: Putative ATP dependent Clp protease [Caudoviricetes sp.]AUW62362.1 Clp protease ClpP [Staphylococcus hominis]